MDGNQEIRPLLPGVKMPAGESPFVEGLRCGECGAKFVDVRKHCAHCGARNSLEPFRLSNTGRLYAYSIVHRSIPGVAVPYVSAIVDLDGGGTLKGNLIESDARPEHLSPGMAVEMTFGVAPQKDDAGNEYLTYFFKPKGDSQ